MEILMGRLHSLTLKIHRYDPELKKSWIQQYNVEVGGMLRFTDVLRKINQEQDPGLAWISSCEHAQCGSCGVVVNGKPLLMCELLVQNAIKQFKTTTFTLKPLSIAPVLRDLIVDLGKAFERVHKAKPYIIEPADPPPKGDEHRIPPQVMERYVEATRCINCFCCAEACISSHRGFLGPNAMLVNIVRLFDPKEAAKKERLDILYADDGIARCHTSAACSFVCPKEIDVAHFIALGKEAKFS
ncbi:succinate dehydrogenase/fumarate reductase iron-sulfur subunit [bacterium]|nr:succinate dehydrogenase/fumarate reductase iron-sulfur subunit [bacterium]